MAPALPSRPPVVVVTGASAGVGRAVAREFASRGAAITLVARGPDGLDAAREEVEARGGRAIVSVTDVADAGAVEAAALRTEEEHGPIDVWVNNAMTTVFSPLLSMTPDEFRRVTEVTYLGYVHGTMAALRRMVPRDRGTVVQVGSALAFQGIPLQSAYCGAKHAIQGFTESVRAELRHDGSRVRVAAVHLPGVNTPQFSWCRSHLDRAPQPVPPVVQPEPVAAAIVEAAEHPRDEILVDLPTVRTVLGSRLAPRLMDRIVARRGYEAQMTDLPTPGGRLGNLCDPVAGDHGAHGPFDADAGDGSPAPPVRAAPRSPVALGASALASALGFAVRLVGPRGS